MPDQQNILGTEKIGKLLLKFAIPSIIGMLVNAVYNIVDQIFIGNGIGYIGNSATNVVFPLITINLALSLLAGQGGASLQNLKLGEGDRETAEKTVENTLLMLIVSGCVICAVSLLFLEPILTLFGATDQSLPYAVDYGRIIVLGLPFVAVQIGMNVTIRADGSPVYAMVSVLVGAILNVILDPLFIFVFDWGIAGAAWATIIGQLVSFAISIFYFPRYKHITLTKKCLRPDLSLMRRIAVLGIASLCTQLSIALVQVVMNNLMTKYGALSVYGSDIPLACSGIMAKVNMIFIAIVIGIGQGSQPIVSFNYGARQYDRVKRTYLTTIKAASIVAVCAFVVFEFFPQYIISLFGEGSAEYFIFAEKCFKISLAATFLNGVQPATTVFFTSIGKGTKGTIISLTRQVFFLLPLMFILPEIMGIDGILWAYPIADTAAFVVVCLLMRHEFKSMNALKARQQ